MVAAVASESTEIHGTTENFLEQQSHLPLRDNVSKLSLLMGNEGNTNKTPPRDSLRNIRG